MNFNEIFPHGLDVTEAFDLLQPVVIYILGMSIYAIFIFKFHQFVAAKDVFGFDISKYEEGKLQCMAWFQHRAV